MGLKSTRNILNTNLSGSGKASFAVSKIGRPRLIGEAPTTKAINAAGIPIKIQKSFETIAAMTEASATTKGTQDRNPSKACAERVLVTDVTPSVRNSFQHLSKRGEWKIRNRRDRPPVAGI